MSDIYHHAIVVTAGVDEWALIAREKAIEIFSEEVPTKHDTIVVNESTPRPYQRGGLEKLVSPIIKSKTNNYSTFLVGPDGSGVGYDTCDHGYHCRARFVEWLAGDESPSLSWILVRYGDLERGSEIERAHDRYDEDDEEER